MSADCRKYYVYFQDQEKFYEVDKSFYYNFYRDIWAKRKRMQRTGECVCPQADYKYCDGDCFDCKHYRNLAYSLDQSLSDDLNVCLCEAVTDSTPMEELLESVELNNKISELVSSLPETEKTICFALMNGLNNREIMRLINYTGNDVSFNEYKSRRIAKIQKKMNGFLI